MAQMINVLQAQFFALDGKPLAGGTVRVYEAGTVTPKVTYNSSACTVQNVWPVVLDYAGQADIYVQGSCRVQVFDRLGVLIDDVDGLQDFSQLSDPNVLAYVLAQIREIYDADGSVQIAPSVSGGSYVDGVLTYTSGQLRPGLNAAGVIINRLALLEFAGNTPAAYTTCSNASTGFDEVFQSTPATRPCLSALIGFSGAGTVDIGWATIGDSGNYTITVGTDPFTVEFLTDRIVLTVGGVVHVSPICPVPIATPYTKFFTSSSAEVDFFTSGDAATGLLPDETAARIAGDAALADAIDDVQTLAEVNQLNITEKADQTDLDTLQTTVTGQGLTLAQKADQTALDALTTVVSGKATPADITAAIAALVDGAPAALDTLAELATALAGDQAQISDILAALALRVRVDAVQSLTLAQQLQARQNINAEAVGVAAGLVAAITPASIGAATAVQGAKADTALQSADLAPVAFSGAYSALTGLPTIPDLSSSTPAAPTTGGTAGAATTAARGDHAHPLPTSAQITAAVLTGLASGSATAIAAADTLLAALEKLQAQISAKGLANLAEVLNTSAPNATVPVVGWTPNRIESNADLVLSPKGSGAIIAHVPDSSATGGNKRGIGAVDLQMGRGTAAQVASGNYSVALGYANTASGNYSVALGAGNGASGNYSVALGYANAASGYAAVAFGYGNGASGVYSVALGCLANTRTVPCATAQGWYLDLAGFQSDAGGSYQSAVYPLWNGTNDATPVSLFSGTIGSVDRYPVIPARHGWSFDATVCARSPSDFVVWDIKGMVVCDASGVATLVGTPTINKRGQTHLLLGWSVDVGIKSVTGGNAVDFIVTGAASTKIAWNATMRTIETFCQ